MTPTPTEKQFRRALKVVEDAHVAHGEGSVEHEVAVERFRGVRDNLRAERAA